MKKTHAPVVTQMTSYDRDDAISVITPFSQASLLAELMVRVAATTPEKRTLVVQCTVHRGEHDVSLPIDIARVSIPAEVLCDALDAMDSNLTFLGAPVLTEAERSAVCDV